MKSASALAQIRQLCNLGLPGATVMPELLGAIRHLVPSDWAGFFWVDERGDMLDLYSERMLSPVHMGSYFARFYDSAPHRFRERFLARSAGHDSVISFTPDDTFECSEYYQEILLPLEAHHTLYAIIGHGGRAFGQLSLYRSRSQRPFGEAERSQLAGVIRYLSYVLAAPPTETSSEPSDFRGSEQEALVVCNAKGEVQEASAKAFGLLARAGGKQINRQTIRSEVAETGAHLLTRVLKSIDPPDDSTSGRLDRYVDNRWGRFRLRAYSLDGPGAGERFGIVIEQQTHYLVRLVVAMGHFPLSAQQREVALLIAQGLSNAEIASLMGVSANTASYHIKQLFQKLNASDRDDAVARIEAAARNSSPQSISWSK